MVERTRALHWTALVSGETATAMAKNLECMFSMGGATVTRAEPGGRDPDGPPAKKPKKAKEFNPKGYADAWSSKAVDFANVFRKALAELNGKDACFLLPNSVSVSCSLSLSLSILKIYQSLYIY